MDELLKEAEKGSTLDTAALDKENAGKFVTDPVKNEPSVDISIGAGLSEEDLEALAQTDQNADDKLMAEFQKILGGDKT